MSDLMTQEPYLFSSLGTDPELSWLVELFVAEMPERIEKLLALADRSDWPELARSAHQIKGSAGSYGFSGITPFAYRLEMAAKAQAHETEIRESLDALVDACNRIRVGVPEVATV